MSKTIDELELAPEAEKVILFKMEWLILAGFSPDNAELIASSEADWHRACDLLRQGANEELVLRVLL